MKNDRHVRRALGVLFGFFIQFLFGMIINLFVNLPKIHPGSTGTHYFSRSSRSLSWVLSGHGGWELTVHAYLALVLVLGTLSLLVQAVLTDNKLWKIVGSTSFVFTLGATFNGLSFVDYNKNISSMIMATCWSIAVVSLVFGVIISNSKMDQNPKLRRH